MRDDQNTDDVTELGAATEKTLGIYEPEKTESLIVPDARDF